MGMTLDTLPALDRRKILIGIGAGALLPTAAGAQMMMGPDRFRVMELMGGDFAIATSQMALQRASDPNLRGFAQAEINEQMGIAAALGAAPGTSQLRPDQVAIVSRLSATAPGPMFDRMFVTGQIAGHRELLALNSSYASSGADPLGRSVAANALPIIQNHLAFLNSVRRA